MPNRKTITAAIEAYVRSQCDKDKAAWQNLFADDVMHEDPVGMGQRHGIDQITGEFWDHIVRNDVRIWLTDDIIICGNEALAIMACEIGPADNRKRIAPTVDQFVFAEDGKISSVRGLYNLV